MDAKPDRTALKWYSLRPTGLTPEYVSGILAGLGLGVVLLSGALQYEWLPPYWNTIRILGFLLIVIGSSMARHFQRTCAESHE
jgi:hypothetical protein